MFSPLYLSTPLRSFRWQLPAFPLQSRLWISADQTVSGTVLHPLESDSLSHPPPSQCPLLSRDQASARLSSLYYRLFPLSAHYCLGRNPCSLCKELCLLPQIQNQILLY